MVGACTEGMKVRLMRSNMGWATFFAASSHSLCRR